MRGPTENFVYEFGPFVVDAAEYRLLREGRPVPLKPKVFQLLLMLVRNSGHILTKRELMDEIWPDSFVEEHNLAVGIFALRKALQERHDNSYIETVPRLGYRFVAEVKTHANQSRDLGFTKTNRDSATDKDSASGTDVQSLAVLPFKLIADTTRTEYLGLGISDALITRLSNLGQFIVRPTAAVRNYADAEDPIVAGRNLKVTAVLDGSIHKLGRQVRVTVQLISVETGAALWADSFDETFSNVFKVEDSISARVTGALMVRLSSPERLRLARPYTMNARAYQAYMKGRFLCEKRTTDHLRRGRKCFEQAIELDPGYALAYIELARCYVAHTDPRLWPRDDLTTAKRLILKALKMDEGLAEAHALLGFIYLLRDWDRPSAEREFHLALELNPHSAESHQFYSYHLKATGRLDESILEIRRAQEIDPTSLSIIASVGITLYLARRYDEAIRELEEALELEASCFQAHFGLGLVHEQKGDFAKAIHEYETANELAHKTNCEVSANLGRAYALSGQRVRARAVLRQLVALSKANYVSQYYMAYVYVGLDDKREALKCLEKSFENRDMEFALIAIDPALDILRSDARFTSLMNRSLLNSPTRPHSARGRKLD